MTRHDSEMAKPELRILGRSLKSVRETLSFSGKKLAEATGISASYISEIETGKRPMTESFAQRVAEAMRLEYDDFCGRLERAYTPHQFDSKPMRIFNEPTPYGAPSVSKDESTDKYQALATLLVSQMDVSAAWDLARSLLDSASSGDVKASLSAQALLDLLTPKNHV